MHNSQPNRGSFCFVAALAVSFCTLLSAAPDSEYCPFGLPELCADRPNPRPGTPKPFVASKSATSPSSNSAPSRLAAVLEEEGDPVFFDSFEECMDFFEAYPDVDNDGWGAEVDPTLFCRQFPAGWVLITGDCDDTREEVNPGEPEICDGLDNNCDDSADNGAFQDTVEPNESCSSVAHLPSVGSNQTLVEFLTVFPEADSDYFEISAIETDSNCECCDFFCLDEDYELEILLSVPSGAGSYAFCTGDPCAAVEENCLVVLAGSQNSWIWTLDGACIANDEYIRWVRVYGWSSPGWSCKDYVLSYRFTPGCF